MNNFENITEMSELQEFVNWANSKGVSYTEIELRKLELLKTNFLARKFNDEANCHYHFDNKTEEQIDNYTSNHSGYFRSGSENWEHDNTGNQSNYSGVVDILTNATIEHDGLENNYDY